MSTGLKVAISAGELSGDEHAAGVVAALRSLRPDVEVKGMGGRNLRAQGVETIVDAETSASVMGFVAVLGSLGKILGALSTMKKLIRDWKPDILILVDYPDFNLRLASYAHSLGIKVLYFIPPSVWAWRASRLELMKKIVDCAALIYPFEEQHYRTRGFKNAHFVGHPFADMPWKKASHIARAEFAISLGLSPEAPLVLIFPGSRKSEIKLHLGLTLEALKLLRAKVPSVQALIGVAPSLDISEINLQVGDLPGVRVVKEDPIDLLSISDVGLLKSGTSNLQAIFFGLPFVMFYVASGLAATIVRTFVKLKEYSIVNVLKPGTVTELTQEFATPEALSAELESLLMAPEKVSELRDNFREVISLLSLPKEGLANLPGGTAYERVANLILDKAK